MQHLLALVQVLDELGDAACESKLGRFIAALIGERDFQALVEERELAQALRQNFIVVLVILEDRRIGMEGDLRARFARLAGDLDLALRLPDFVGLLPDLAIRAKFQAPAYPTARFTTETPTPCSPPETLYVSLSNFPPACSTVITTSAAGFFSVACMSRNAAAIVDHGDAVVLMHLETGSIASPRERFVDRVVQVHEDNSVTVIDNGRGHSRGHACHGEKARRGSRDDRAARRRKIRQRKRTRFPADYTASVFPL